MELPPVQVQERTAAVIAAAISRSREQSLHGNFDEALATLDAALDLPDMSDTDRVALFRGSARVFTRCGFPVFAKDCLDKAAAVPTDHINSADRLALLVHRAYVYVVGCGEDPGNEENVALVRAQKELDSEIDGALDEGDPRVEMYDFVTKITLIRELLRGKKGLDSDTKCAAAARLDRLMRHFEEQRRYYNMQTIMGTFLNCSAAQVSIQRLESVLAVSEIPMIFRGLWCLELARMLARVGRMSEAASRLDEAEGAFQSCAQAKGLLEVRFLRLQHGLTPSSNVLADLIDLMRGHLEANFPYGVLQTALEILNVAFQKGDLTTYFKVQEVLHNVCTTAGLVTERVLREITLLTVLNAGASDAGKVLELGQTLYRDCLERGYWTPAYLVGRVVSLCHLQLGNLEESESISLEIHRLSQRENLRLEPQAAYHLALIQSINARAKGPSPVTNSHVEIVDWLLGTIPDDAQLDRDPEEKSAAVDKLCLIAELQLEMSRTAIRGSGEMAAKGQETMSRARKLAEELPEDEMLRINANCDDLLIVQLVYEGKRTPTDDKKELEAIAICDRFIVQHEARGSKFATATKHIMRANCYLQRFQKSTDATKRLSCLGPAEDDYLKAVAIYESTRFWNQVIKARHFLSHLYVIARGFIRGLVTDDAIFSSLRELEAACERIRRELSVLGSLRALREKQKFAAAKEVCDFYQWAIGLSISNQDHQATWWWSQKRKARGLSDLLGIGVIVPAAIKQRIAQDESATELYQRLTSLQTALTVTPETEKVYLRQNLEEVEEEMRKHESFREFVLLRDGTVRGIGDLKALDAVIGGSKSRGKREVIFVDWVAFHDTIYVLTTTTSNPTETCQASLLPFGISHVQKWMSDHFHSEEQRRDCLKRDNLKDPSKPMRQLDCLVAPVVAATKPGDLLIFSTTSFLSALPLHALRVGNDAYSYEGGIMSLIERNPVIYAPNFPITQICLARSREPVRKDHHGSVFFGILDVEREARAIYQQMERLARSYGGHSQSFCGAQATKQNFAAASPHAALIHYHGHCVFAVEDPLKQRLVMAEMSEAAVADTSLTTHAQEEKELATANTTKPDMAAEAGFHLAKLSPALGKDVPNPCSDETVLLSVDSTEDKAVMEHCLAVPEVFNLQLTAAPLVVLVGCDSASQKVSTGDESLGLITALLCAGAASVVGASWPIPSAAGRAFSDAFYASMDTQLSTVGQGALIDLAVALQEATLSIMDEPGTSAPYYWAGFCLYGSWLFRK